MNFIKSSNPDGSIVKLFYRDYGTGRPVVFIHGWPLSHKMWEYQTSVLPNYGFRCIAYDRRGFGYSDKPWTGYDYNTLADDLNAVLDELNLNNVILVGFSMGGGEIARYFSRHGGNRVSKVVLVSTVLPYLLQTAENEHGLPQDKLTEMIESIQNDRADFLRDFAKQFYGVSLLSHPVSQAVLDWDFTVAMQASLRATVECAHAFAETDFRADMRNINVPTLIIHGDADETVPINASSDHTADLIPQAEYIIYEGAPHGLFFTEKDAFNGDLIQFMQVQSEPISTREKAW